MANEMPTNPTDEELAAWYAERFGEPPRADEFFAVARQVVEARFLATAADIVLCASWADEHGGRALAECRELAKSLRTRFPRPIDEGVLRACGFSPPEMGSEFWRDGEGAASLKASAGSGGTWGVSPCCGPVFFCVHTADRFVAVCEALRILYGEED